MLAISPKQEHETLWRDPLSEPDNNLEPESDEQLSDHGPAFLPASVAGTSSTWPNLSIDNAGVVGSHHPGFVPHGRDDTLMPDLFGRHRFEVSIPKRVEHQQRSCADPSHLLDRLVMVMGTSIRSGKVLLCRYVKLGSIDVRKPVSKLNSRQFPLSSQGSWLSQALINGYRLSLAVLR